MLRIGLTLYLTLAMLAGPALCCCGAERLTARFPSPAKQDDQPSCPCRHHQAAGDGKHHSSEQRPEKPEQPARSPCPCKDHRAQETPLASLESSPSQQLQARHALEGPLELLAVLPTTLCMRSPGTSLASKEGAAWPFWTAQDILRALHILRC